jgi:hypothetical protein
MSIVVVIFAPFLPLLLLLLLFLLLFFFFFFFFTFISSREKSPLAKFVVVVIIIAPLHKNVGHQVDTTLYLEGERYHSFRLLRVVKNRFGANSECAVLDMTDRGMVEVTNPSALFLSTATVRVKNEQISNIEYV